MPFKTIPGTDVTYALLAFDANGRERTDDPESVNGQMSTRVLQDAAANRPSHIFFFSHGWKGDVPGAIHQYDGWIKAMTDRTADAAAMGAGFKPLWIGLHWPSLPWGDDELGSDSFEASSVPGNELLERYVTRLGGDSRGGSKAAPDHHRRERDQRRSDDAAPARCRRVPPTRGGDRPQGGTSRRPPRCRRSALRSRASVRCRQELGVAFGGSSPRWAPRTPTPALVLEDEEPSPQGGRGRHAPLYRELPAGPARGPDPPDGPQLRMHRRLFHPGGAGRHSRPPAAGRLPGPGPGRALTLGVRRPHPGRHHPGVLQRDDRRGPCGARS